MTDHKFDELKKELLELEKNHPYLKINKSILNYVGYKPSEKFQKLNIQKNVIIKQCF